MFEFIYKKVAQVYNDTHATEMLTDINDASI